MSRSPIYWIPAERALVVGDVLLGAGVKPRATDEPLRLSALPVEQILVSHGAPVLTDAARQLRDTIV